MGGKLINNDLLIFVLFFTLIYVTGGVAQKLYFLKRAKVGVQNEFKYLAISPFYSTCTWQRITKALKNDRSRIYRKLSLFSILLILIFVLYQCQSILITDYAFRILFISITFYISTELIGVFCSDLISALGNIDF